MVRILCSKSSLTVKIDNADNLDVAIAEWLTWKPSVLTGDEFRFLRLRLDMSQKLVGKLMGKDLQTVALWEKNNTVRSEGDFMIRHIYR